MCLGITVCDHSASLIMSNGDPLKRFFYPTITLMIDSYNPFFRITVCHHSASLVMPNGDPRGRFFYPTLTLMIDSYSLSKPRDAKKQSPG